jgi:hypothetical protein
LQLRLRTIGQHLDHLIEQRTNMGMHRISGSRRITRIEQRQRLEALRRQIEQRQFPQIDNDILPLIAPVDNPTIVLPFEGVEIMLERCRSIRRISVLAKFCLNFRYQLFRTRRRTQQLTHQKQTSAKGHPGTPLDATTPACHAILHTYMRV